MHRPIFATNFSVVDHNLLGVRKPLSTLNLYTQIQNQSTEINSRGKKNYYDNTRFALLVDINENSGISFDGEANSESDAPATKATILDLYSGCGGMSTGLCLGAVIAGVQMETVQFYLIVLKNISD